MNTRPLVSVLMPVRNGAQFVEECLLSLLVQTVGEFEVIVIDDGSTDGTADVVRQFADERIRLVVQENVGTTRSLNRALGLARGGWIARQDADDFSIAWRIERQLEFLRRWPERRLVGCSCFVSNSRGIFNEVFGYPATDEAIQAALPFYNPFVHGSVMVERRLLEEVGGYDESYRYAQDYELWSRLMDVTPLWNLEEPLYARYRLAGSSELSVHKHSVVEEIQARIKRRRGTRVLEDVEGIQARDFAPIVGVPVAFARILGGHYRRVARLARTLGRNWRRYEAKAYFYGGVWAIGVL